MIYVYPKVFVAGKRQKVCVRFDTEDVDEQTELYIKIQPMEVYEIKHTKNYRIDEEDRYSYARMTAVGNKIYTFEYDFFEEQRYDVKVKLGDKIIWHTHAYSINEDLIGVEAFKGDTHLHTKRSDGEGTPFEVGCAYRAEGFDFIAITDHHLHHPSVEGQEAFAKLTDKFKVFKGEEVHNRHMGYFHIVNFDGDFSVNEILETQTDYVEKEIERILAETEIPESVADKYDCAYRIFVSEQIRKGNGFAVMAHPYWDCYAEYHIPTETIKYLLTNGHYDALELIAGCDWRGLNGNNLQVALWEELRECGIKIPVLGATDSHNRRVEDSLFTKQFSLVFAKDFTGIKDGIKAERSVAVLAHDPTNFLVFGRYRFVKYARFLLQEYFSQYRVLSQKHATALLQEDPAQISVVEKEIEAFKKEFFAW